MSEDTYKILIVEDEVAMQLALADKLRKNLFEVVIAADGEAAVDVAYREHPDLIMMDILMPKKDGLAAMKEIREKDKWGAEVPIILLTNLSDPESVALAANFRVYDFLVKTDWRLDDVVNLVKEKLNIV
jgi:two-component system, OmpR family, response regulator VicR